MHDFLSYTNNSSLFLVTSSNKPDFPMQKLTTSLWANMVSTWLAFSALGGS
jgi:hypothetical protein